jgi:hypothetical protein
MKGMRGADPAAAGAVVVRLADGRSFRFSGPFHIGRDAGCEVQVAENQVSRRHAQVSRQQGQWIIRDLQSSNGLFVDGTRVETAAIAGSVSVRLGMDGPSLQIASEVAVPSKQPRGMATSSNAEESLEDYAQRYFRADDDAPVGDRTMMIRRAFQRIQQEQKRRSRIVIAIIALAGVAVAAYAWHEHTLVLQQEQQAEDWYYKMKDMDVRIAFMEQQAAAAGKDPSSLPGSAQDAADRKNKEKQYDAIVARLYDRKLDEKDRLILKVTRLFGECDIAAPPDYLAEVKRYIQKWQSTGRFARAVKLSQERGYPHVIANAFIAQNLPPQYYYLAMQETNFDAFAIGLTTHWGIAKGMWQFIPETGLKFGLKPGPLQRVASFDNNDERFNWIKATGAAARYIKDIYSTDAQASGLLVMASYNWGEYRVIDRVRAMPPDPRLRNFWRLLANHQVPAQTYDYVFYIVSAAVIGENPRLFGFDFDNPLKFAQTQ